MKDAGSHGAGAVSCIRTGPSGPETLRFMSYVYFVPTDRDQRNAPVGGEALERLLAGPGPLSAAPCVPAWPGPRTPDPAPSAPTEWLHCLCPCPAFCPQASGKLDPISALTSPCRSLPRHQSWPAGSDAVLSGPAFWAQRGTPFPGGICERGRPAGCFLLK